MTLDQLIEQLEALREEHGGEIAVRLAHQPRWAMQYEVGRIVVADTAEEPDEPGELRELGPLVCYIGEGPTPDDEPYLPEPAAAALGWGRR